ncbi:MAG TPA: polysaccharide deacetylase family protein, partial [Gemmataceae bacterium]|nr:polysaccharide deacetylase family protein [Gemmataceae bacterium]
MTHTAYITTSWDDGHPSDFRVAELLAKYGLRGTFYIPRTAEMETISESQIRELAGSFEVGGHTIHHVVLPEAPDAEARREIVESKSWLKDLTGRPCPMFCPPKGKFRRLHLDMVREAGYAGVRTVELLSLDFPRPTAGLMVLPTTVQAHQHEFA